MVNPSRSVLIKRPFNGNLLERVSLNTGLSPNLLGHNPEVYMHYEDLTNYDIPGLEDAVKTFEMAANKRMKIKAYCDYDVDGMGAGTIMNIFGQAINVPVDVYIPDRHADGYGLTVKYVESLGDDLSDVLLMTFDNGIATHEAIDLAKSRGATVIVMDHHQPFVNEHGQTVLPNADVICDPHVTGGTCQDYCGAGLAYKFVQRCIEDTKLNDAQKKVVLNMTCVQAAISTIADDVPLSLENYQIVEKGLTLLAQGKCTYGMKLLADKFNLSNKENIPVSDVSFGLVPALNAWGRLEGEGSKEVFKVLSYCGGYDATIASAVDTMYQKNENRKFLTQEAVDRATQIVIDTRQEDKGFVVVYDPDCKHGLCGLGASKLVEKYQAPVIVLSGTENVIHGSGRSYGNVDLKAALDQVSKYLYSYGGHPGACGVAIEKSRLNDFIKAIQELFPEKQAVEHQVFFDTVLSVNQAKDFFLESQLYMWGVGNPEPIVLMKDLSVADSRVMGATKSTIKLTCCEKGEDTSVASGVLPTIAVMSFSDAALYGQIGSPEKIVAIGTLSENVFKGNRTLQLRSSFFDDGQGFDLEKDTAIQGDSIEEELCNP